MKMFAPTEYVQNAVQTAYVSNAILGQNCLEIKQKLYSVVADEIQ